MASVSARKVTEAELLAMPDDGVERWIIRGELREKPPEVPGVTMTVRNRHHTRVMSYVVATLVIWLRAQPQPRGEVYSGEVGVLLPTSPGTSVGVDVVYVPADVVAVQTPATTLIDGVPTLAVEILSPNDTQEQIEEKIDTYIGAGVPLVWIVNPYRSTVAVHRPGHEPDTFNRNQRLPQYPEMPGFVPTVAELFE